MPINLPPTLPIPQPQQQQQGLNLGQILALKTQRDNQQRQSQLDQLRLQQGQKQAENQSLNNAISAVEGGVGAKDAASMFDVQARFIPMLDALDKQRKQKEKQAKAESDQNQSTQAKEQLGAGLVFGDPRAATVDALRQTEQRSPNDPAALRALTAGGALEADKLLGQPSQLGTIQATADIQGAKEVKVFATKEDILNRRGRTEGERLANQLRNGTDLFGNNLTDGHRKELERRMAQLDAQGNEMITIEGPDGTITMRKGAVDPASNLSRVRDTISDQAAVINMLDQALGVIQQEPARGGVTGKVVSAITTIKGIGEDVRRMFAGTQIADTTENLESFIANEVISDRANQDLIRLAEDSEAQGFLDALEFNLAYRLALSKKRSGRINIEDLRQARRVVNIREAKNFQRVKSRLRSLRTTEFQDMQRNIKRLRQAGDTIVGPDLNPRDIQKMADEVTERVLRGE